MSPTKDTLCTTKLKNPVTWIIPNILSISILSIYTFIPLGLSRGALMLNISKWSFLTSMLGNFIYYYFLYHSLTGIDIICCLPPLLSNLQCLYDWWLWVKTRNPKTFPYWVLTFSSLQGKQYTSKPGVPALMGGIHYWPSDDVLASIYVENKYVQHFKIDVQSS